MAKTKEQKGVIVEKLEGAFKEGTSAVFVHFTGLTVADEMAMRKSLRKDGVSYFVAKKTLIRRALEALGHKHEDVPMKGEVAVAWTTGDDTTAPARLIHGFGVKLKEKLEILGGLFENKLIGQAAMQEIATIPPVDVLRGMFANVINSPIQRFAIALSEVAKVKN
ncbi:50S ribosomal protein L10 [Candidatus Parcubacteria bacterium]|nr:MAG: 50S ribosomal protein L10 [Candidatus Parcubacteria bacterium]